MKHYRNIKDLLRDVELPQDIIDFINYLNADITLGRHELSNGNFAVVMELNSKIDNGEEREYEVHRKYFDIQILLIGEEIMSTCQYNSLKITRPYDEKTDYEFFCSKPISFVPLKPFEPLLINKEEPHSGGLSKKENYIRKVIIKFQ